MVEKIRTFVAVALPEDVVVAIDRVERALAAFDFKIRWVDPHKIHLTLKFLGDVPLAGIDAIADALAAAVSKHPPLTLHATGVGAFPGFKRPRIIWVGLGDQMQALSALQRDVETHLAALGFAPEKRPFRAHLTMGRVKGAIDSRRLIEAVNGLQRFESPPFAVREVAIFRSELRPGGAEYTKLRVVQLQGDTD